jgi:hypothetical protein
MSSSTLGMTARASGRGTLCHQRSVHDYSFTNMLANQQAVADDGVGRNSASACGPSLAGDFARFCQRLFERYALYSAALHICNSAPCLILPSLVYRRVDFTVFGAQYSIDQIGDRVLGPIAGLFDNLICAQLHFVSLHWCSITCNIVLSVNIEFCVSFA